VVEPGQVSGDGSVVSPVTPRDLQGDVLGHAGLHQAAQGVLVQGSTASLHVRLEGKQGVVMLGINKFLERLS